jgi:hypothetical protein
LWKGVVVISILLLLGSTQQLCILLINYFHFTHLNNQIYKI